MLDWGTVFSNWTSVSRRCWSVSFSASLFVRDCCVLSASAAFCILHDLGRIGVTYDSVDGPPLGIRKHQRGESGDAVGFL